MDWETCSAVERDPGKISGAWANRACLRFGHRSVVRERVHDRLRVREALQEDRRRSRGRQQEDAEDGVGRIADTESGATPNR